MKFNTQQIRKILLPLLLLGVGMFSVRIAPALQAAMVGSNFSGSVNQRVWNKTAQSVPQAASLLAPPTLGSYSSTLVTMGGNSSITPSTAPTGATSVTVATSTDFKGTLFADPTTGVVRVTNAHPAGVYTIALTAFGSGGNANATFSLTVQSGPSCDYWATSPVNIATGAYPKALTIGDFNNDGKQDLVAVVTGSSSILIMLGNGTGGFSSPTNFSVGTSPVWVAVGDFNGDGKQDLAVANYSSNNVSILRGNGMGGFSLTANITVAGPGNVAVSDFNSDGKQDLAITYYDNNLGQGGFSIALGDGQGGFGSPTQIATANALPKVMAVGDFNSDGKQDLAIVGGQFILIRLGDGLGGFSSGAAVDAGNGSNFVTVGDFNGDGKQDLAATSGFQSVAIRLGDGLGNFSGSTMIGTGNSPFSIEVSDFNSDGKQDLVISNADSDTLSIRLGDGAGGFTNLTEFSSVYAPLSVVVGDFNGDGKQDLASANNETDTISVRMGGCNPPRIVPVAGVTRIAGETSNSKIATVTDADQALNTLSVESSGSNWQITNITVDANGDVRADVKAPCGPSHNTFISLTVTDSGGLTTSGVLSALSLDNRPPLLVYNDQSVAAGGSLTFRPFTAYDEGGITVITLISRGSYTGDISANPTTGEITLSNAKPGGSHAITLRARDNCGATSDTTFTLTVNCPSIAITPSSLPVAVLGAAYGSNLTASGGTPGYSFAVTAGALPPGLTLNSNGSWSGAPTTVGMYSFTVTATDAYGCVASMAYTLAVNCQITVTPTSLPGSIPGAVYSANLTASGGTPAYSFAVTAGALPPGLTLNSNGSWSGAPTTVGAYNFTVTVTDANGCYASRAYTVNIVPPLTLGDYPNTNVGLSSNPVITPSIAPINVSGVTVSASSDFKGAFAADPLTGVVRVINAHPAGAYTVTVKGFSLDVSTSKTFTLTVQNGLACSSVAFTDAADVGVTAFPGAVAVGDFNRDGKQDLAIANSGSVTVSIRLGNGMGGFSGTTEVSVAGSALALTVGDFNSDGILDLAVACFGPDAVSIRLGDGQGAFSGATNIGVGEFPQSLALGDFNSDGKQDLAVANLFSNTVSVRLGDGLGGFSGATEVSTGAEPASVVIGDFNRDGKQDMAVVNSGAGTVSIRLGDGLGQFSGTTEISVGAYPYSAVIGDFNGDGKQDLAVANQAANTVSIRLGDGLGGFNGSANIAVGDGPYSVAAGDFNGDGKQDLAVVSSYLDSISILIGNGAGGFSGLPEINVGVSPRAVAVGDFNNDGKQDLAAANSSSNNVSIRLGGCVNTPPTIAVASPLTRQQGSSINSAQIATVGDADQAVNTLSVSSALLTGSGVTIGGVSVDAAGNVTANIVASCVATTSTFRLTVTDSGNSTATVTLTVNVVASVPPSITTPPANQTVCEGTPATFSVTATGALSYQWRKGGMNINGATSSSYTIDAATMADAGSYDVVVTGSCGTPATSSAATLIVNNCPPATGLQFYPLAHPVRLLDTRAGATGCDTPGAMISGQTARTQTAAGRMCDGLTIPANAKALTGNITTVESGGGFLTLFPSDVTRPLVANSNFAANQVLNNVFTVGLGAAEGAFKIYVTTNTNVVVDITGYYAPPSASGLYFHPLPKPVRLLDTRAGATACFTPGAQLTAGSTTTQLGATTCDGVLIPAGAQALVGNATTVSPQTNGFLTLFPADATRPLAASSNFQTGINMNAPFTVGLSPSGEFNIYTAAATNLVVDVLGYYSTQLNDTNGQGLLFNPLPAPVRLLDTRAGATGCFTPGGQMTGGTSYLQPATGACTGIPVAAKAVVGNATTVNVAANGFLTFWPSDATQPFIATSNYRSGTVFNRHFTVGLGADGAFKRFASSTTDLVVDLSGYFAP